MPRGFHGGSLPKPANRRTFALCVLDSRAPSPARSFGRSSSAWTSAWGFCGKKLPETLGAAAGRGGPGAGVGAVRVRRMAADRVPDRRPCHRAVRQACRLRPRGAERGHGQGERRRVLPLRPPWQALALGAAAAFVRRQRGPRGGPDGRDRRFVHMGGRPHAPLRRRLPRHDRGRHAGSVDGPGRPLRSTALPRLLRARPTGACRKARWTSSCRAPARRRCTCCAVVGALGAFFGLAELDPAAGAGCRVSRPPTWGRASLRGWCRWRLRARPAVGPTMSRAPPPARWRAAWAAVPSPRRCWPAWPWRFAAWRCSLHHVRR